MVIQTQHTNTERRITIGIPTAQRVDESRLIYNSLSSCKSGKRFLRLWMTTDIQDRFILFVIAIVFILFLVSFSVGVHTTAFLVTYCQALIRYCLAFFCIIYTVTSVYISDCFWFFNISFFYLPHISRYSIWLCAHFVI